MARNVVKVGNRLEIDTELGPGGAIKRWPSTWVTDEYSPYAVTLINNIDNRRESVTIPFSEFTLDGVALTNELDIALALSELIG